MQATPRFRCLFAFYCSEDCAVPANVLERPKPFEGVDHSQYPENTRLRQA